MRRVFLVRHGEMENLTHVLAGPNGNQLSARGRKQIVALAEDLADAGVKRIVSSPVLRARETAGIIAERLSLGTAEDLRLGEWGMGHWVGRPLEEFYAQSGHFRTPVAPERDMEPLEDAAKRVLVAVEEVRAGLGDGESAILVGHREPLVSALITLQGASFEGIHDVELPVASAWEIVYTDGAEPVVRKFSDRHMVR